jgi:hypothetical protein
MVSENNHIYNNQGNGQGNAKEIMNTSAPICISSYIKGGQRPGNKNGGQRRQGNNLY